MLYWSICSDFSHPLSFSTPSRDDFFFNLGKSFTDPETRVFLAADGQNIVFLASTIFDWSTRVTDEQTEL